MFQSITVTKREADYVATTQLNNGFMASEGGKTSAEAIGNLIIKQGMNMKIKATVAEFVR